jgi:ABC-2 type transport system permease protein
MRGILAIAGKDLRSLFFSPLFWVIGGLCTLVWSILYFIRLQQFAVSSYQMQMQMAMQGQSEGGANIHFDVFAAHISLVNFIMILAVAALTMRSFAEEKKQRTFDLLLTSPVNATQIVIGKYLGALGAAWALIAISFFYPVATASIATFDWGPLFASYIGLLLLVASYVALGMFSSSLTESAVLAVVMSLIFSVGIWFVGAGSEILDSPTWVAIFEHLSVGTHFVTFIKGSVSIAGIVFFLSVIFLYCFLTQRIVESNRWR